MPIQVNIDKPQRLVTTRCSGELSDDDLAALQERFETDPDFSPKFSRICDLTKVTVVDISDDVLNQWAADPIIDANARHAVVCSKPAVMTSVLDFVARSRRYSRDISVFPNYDQAKNWIDKREETFEA
ncbi:MAG: hypothetical protein QOG48_1016 [Verrucomicrobiota bacterium]|jgi:hypothetical protein